VNAIEHYIQRFPDPVQQKLQAVRRTIALAAPHAEEAMSYGVPAFKQNGYLIGYAAFKKHLGIYPQPSAIRHFADRLVEYETSEGTIRFPLDQPIPFDLIIDIVHFRLEEQRVK
jgi:uncharacterized protein YdhG (YjbR/CyaY superfamily)